MKTVAGHARDASLGSWNGSQVHVILTSAALVGCAAYGLENFREGQLVMLKLTLPEQADLYIDLIKHPKVVRGVALSGGYSQEDADDRLRRDHGMVASFSRALVEGLSAQHSDAEFNSVLEKSIQSIFEASNIKQATIKESGGDRGTSRPNRHVRESSAKG